MRHSLVASTTENIESVSTLKHQFPSFRSSILTVALLTITALQGCAVVAVVDTVGTVAVKTVGLAADAAIGVVKITGRAIGTAADAVIPGGAEP